MCLNCPRLVRHLFAIIDLSRRAEAINQSGNGLNPGGVCDALRPRASFRIGQTLEPRRNYCAAQGWQFTLMPLDNDGQMTNA